MEDPWTNPIIYPIAEGSALYSRVHDGNDLGYPILTKFSDEMRVCSFTDLESIYVHSLEKDKLLLKVSQTGIPLLLTCILSSDETSLEITYLTDMNEDGTVGGGKGNEVFIRETVFLENWDQSEELIEVISLKQNEIIDDNKIIYRADLNRKMYSSV